MAADLIKDMTKKGYFYPSNCPSKMRNHIPNAITLLNLFCGCCALVCVFYGQFPQAFVYIVISGIADYSDGMVARALKVNSVLGKELDSLADMVSFGVVPGAIIYMLLVISLENAAINYPMADFINNLIGIKLTALPAFVISVFAGLRLAKFNLDTRQTEGFIGLNTPACTLFILGLMLIFHNDTYGLRNQVSNIYFLYAIIPILSYLLVSELPMMSFKFKNFSWRDNRRRYSIIIISAVLILFFRELGCSLAIVAYVVFSLYEYLVHGRTKMNVDEEEAE